MHLWLVQLVPIKNLFLRKHTHSYLEHPDFNELLAPGVELHEVQQERLHQVLVRRDVVHQELDLHVPLHS